MTFFEKETEIAARAVELIRERYDIGYEILYDGEHDMYVIAAPADEDEGGDPYQPTAINIGYAEDFEDAEQLYEAALTMTDKVDALVH